MAGTEGETRSLQPTLLVVSVCEVVLLLWICWCCLMKCVCWCLCLHLGCCLGVLRSSLWRTIYISTLMDSLHRSSVIFYGCTSSPWELPHRVVHLNKGEGKMVFQHRGYGSYVCVCRSSLWSLCCWDDMTALMCCMFNCMFCCIISFWEWYLHPGWSSIWWQFIIMV